MTSTAALTRSPAEAVEIVWRRLCRAIDDDLSVEAVRWAKVHAALSRLMSEAASASTAAPPPAPAPSSPRALEKVESNFADSRRPASIDGSPFAFGRSIEPRGTGP